MACVMLVDDDEDVQSVLGLYLQRDGHDVVPARNGEAALREAAGGVDAVLLDLTLPDLDGLEVLRRLRAMGTDLPVLILSARGEEVDRLLGLGLGADDYVVKPFSPREVCLRVAALLRRGGTARRPRMPHSSLLRWGAIAADPEEHRAYAGGREMALTPREFSLLLLFLGHPRHVYSRQAILESLWPEGYVTDHVVDVHIAALRRKLGQGAIVNVRGVGFRLADPEER